MQKKYNRSKKIKSKNYKKENRKKNGRRQKEEKLHRTAKAQRRYKDL